MPTPLAIKPKESSRRRVVDAGTIEKYLFAYLPVVLGLYVAATARAGGRADGEPPLQDIAESTIEQCLQHAREHALPLLAVVVVDEAGALVNFKRQSGAPALIGEAVILKARSAARSLEATSQLAQDAECADRAAAIGSAGEPAAIENDVAAAIRQRLKTYAEDWNRGEIGAVLGQYDPALFAILGKQFMGYAEYTRVVREALSRQDRPGLTSR